MYLDQIIYILFQVNHLILYKYWWHAEQQTDRHDTSQLQLPFLKFTMGANQKLNTQARNHDHYLLVLVMGLCVRACIRVWVLECMCELYVWLCACFDSLWSMKPLLFGKPEGCACGKHNNDSPMYFINMFISNTIIR